uniref:Uncharacterized protein n=1 Tax=Homalodisca liturata TaxID=320908 RepID=A0A1B6IQI6_9HEMI
MSLLIVLLCVLGAVMARPQGLATKQVPYLISRTYQSDDAGQFASSYQSSDSQVIHQVGKLAPNQKKDGLVLLLEGSYAYTSPEGVPVVVKYVADETGYHPTGDIIPKPVVALPPTF